MPFTDNMLDYKTCKAISWVTSSLDQEDPVLIADAVFMASEFVEAACAIPLSTPASSGPASLPLWIRQSVLMKDPHSIWWM